MKENKNTVNLLDLFWYLLANWYWFLLSIIVCTGFVYYRYAKTQQVYRSDATVIIKDPSNTRSSVRLDNYSGMINRVNMSNEILELQSKQLMTEVVKALDADISYTVKDHLRYVELYDTSPVRMVLSRGELPGEPFQASVTPTGEDQIKLVVAGASPRQISAIRLPSKIMRLPLFGRIISRYTGVKKSESPKFVSAVPPPAISPA